MLLRSLTKHIREQNWFAVFLDFFIVVVGILIAFQITNWNEEREARSNLERAELALGVELAELYLNFKERVALANCRKESLSELGQRLMEPDDAWENVHRDNQLGLEGLNFRSVLRSPNRPWSSSVWDSELARGTLNSMDQSKLNDLDTIYGVVTYAKTLQRNIFDTEGQLTALAYTTRLTQSDRLRYFDLVAQINRDSYWLELVSQQGIDGIESIALEALGANISADSLKQTNESTIARYGACYEPVSMPHQEESQ